MILGNLHLFFYFALFARIRGAILRKVFCIGVPGADRIVPSELRTEVMKMDTRNRLAMIRLYERLKTSPGLAGELGVQVSFRAKGQDGSRKGSR